MPSWCHLLMKQPWEHPPALTISIDDEYSGTECVSSGDMCKSSNKLNIVSSLVPCSFNGLILKRIINVSCLFLSGSSDMRHCIQFGPVFKIKKHLRTAVDHFIFVCNDCIILTLPPKILRCSSPEYIPELYGLPSLRASLLDLEFSWKKTIPFDYSFLIVNNPFPSDSPLESCPFSFDLASTSPCSPTSNNQPTPSGKSQNVLPNSSVISTIAVVNALNRNHWIKTISFVAASHRSSSMTSPLSHLPASISPSSALNITNSCADSFASYISPSSPYLHDSQDQQTGSNTDASIRIAFSLQNDLVLPPPHNLQEESLISSKIANSFPVSPPPHLDLSVLLTHRFAKNTLHAAVASQSRSDVDRIILKTASIISKESSTSEVAAALLAEGHQSWKELDCWGCTALHVSVLLKDCGMVASLLSLGAQSSPSLPSKPYLSQQLPENNLPATLNSPSLNILQNKCASPSRFAGDATSRNRRQFLSPSGETPILCLWGETPLHSAARLGASDIVKVLLEDKDISCAWQVTSHGWSLARLAASGPQSEEDSLQTLLVMRKCGVPISSMNSTSSVPNVSPRYPLCTPLQEALLDSDSRAVLHLLKAGVAVDATVGDDSGRTALHLAVQMNDLNTTLLLLQFGAQPNLIDVHGRSPVSYVQTVAMLKLLLSFGARIDFESPEFPDCQSPLSPKSILNHDRTRRRRKIFESNSTFNFNAGDLTCKSNRFALPAGSSPQVRMVDITLSYSQRQHIADPNWRGYQIIIPHALLTSQRIPSGAGENEHISTQHRLDIIAAMDFFANLSHNDRRSRPTFHLSPPFVADDPIELHEEVKLAIQAHCVLGSVKALSATTKSCSLCVTPLGTLGMAPHACGRCNRLVCVECSSKRLPQNVISALVPQGLKVRMLKAVTATHRRTQLQRDLQQQQQHLLSNEQLPLINKTVAEQDTRSDGDIFLPHHAKPSNLRRILAATSPTTARSRAGFSTDMPTSATDYEKDINTYLNPITPRASTRRHADTRRVSIVSKTDLDLSPTSPFSSPMRRLQMAASPIIVGSPSSHRHQHAYPIKLTTPSPSSSSYSRHAHAATVSAFFFSPKHRYSLAATATASPKSAAKCNALTQRHHKNNCTPFNTTTHAADSLDKNDNNNIVNEPLVRVCDGCFNSARFIKFPTSSNANIYKDFSVEAISPSVESVDFFSSRQMSPVSRRVSPVPPVSAFTLVSRLHTPQSAAMALWGGGFTPPHTQQRVSSSRSMAQKLSRFFGIKSSALNPAKIKSTKHKTNEDLINKHTMNIIEPLEHCKRRVRLDINPSSNSNDAPFNDDNNIQLRRRDSQSSSKSQIKSSLKRKSSSSSSLHTENSSFEHQKDDLGTAQALFIPKMISKHRQNYNTTHSTSDNMMMAFESNMKNDSSGKVKDLTVFVDNQGFTLSYENNGLERCTNLMNKSEKSARAARRSSVVSFVDDFKQIKNVNDSFMSLGIVDDDDDEWTDEETRYRQGADTFAASFKSGSNNNIRSPCSSSSGGTSCSFETGASVSQDEIPDKWLAPLSVSGCEDNYHQEYIIDKDGSSRTPLANSIDDDDDELEIKMQEEERLRRHPLFSTFQLMEMRSVKHQSQKNFIREKSSNTPYDGYNLTSNTNYMAATMQHGQSDGNKCSISDFYDPNIKNGGATSRHTSTTCASPPRRSPAATGLRSWSNSFKTFLLGTSSNVNTVNSKDQSKIENSSPKKHQEQHVITPPAKISPKSPIVEEVPRSLNEENINSSVSEKLNQFSENQMKTCPNRAIYRTQRLEELRRSRMLLKLNGRNPGHNVDNNCVQDGM